MGMDLIHQDFHNTQVGLKDLLQWSALATDQTESQELNQVHKINDIPV